MLGFSNTQIKNFQMPNLGLQKVEEPEIKLPSLTESQRKQGNFRGKNSIYFSSAKSLTVWIITNCGNLLKRWEYQTILLVSWETCTSVKKQQLETCMEQNIGSGLRKEYHRAVCCHPVCLAYMLSTSSEMLGWMSDRLKSRYVGGKSTTSDMRMIYTTLIAGSEEELKNHLVRVKKPT